MKQFLLALAIAALLLAACSSAQSTPTPKPTLRAEPTRLSSAEASSQAQDEALTAVPPTLEPTATDLPPTPTLQQAQDDAATTAPSPTATAIPPSPSPSPTMTMTMTMTETPAPTRTPSVEKIRDVPFVVDGDPSQQLDVYLPTGSAGPYPVLLAMHGGGADKRDLGKLALRFAQLGYATLALNFRDMPRHTYPAPVQDAFCALAWTLSNAETYNFDTGRIVAVGHSVGGALAAMLAAVDDPARYLQDCPHELPETNLLQGAVAFTGVFDYMNFSSISYFHDYLNGQPSQAPETWAEASVVTWIDGSEPPLLLIHGEADTNITPENSTDFAAVLERAGVMVTVLIVPNARHGDIINHAQAFEAMEAFLETLAE